MSYIPRRLARMAVQVLAATWRVEIEGEKNYLLLRERGDSMVFATWHSTLLPVIWSHKIDRTALLVSSHRDGGYLADAAEYLGYRTIRGSSTRHGVAGLVELLQQLKTGGEVGITPDGPRGPARIVKPGGVFAAQKTGASVVPVGAEVSTFWKIKSWDVFLVPLPFARVRVVYGTPFKVDDGPEGLLRGVRKLQRRLDALSAAPAC